jgi:hypothetical protein
MGSFNSPIANDQWLTGERRPLGHLRRSQVSPQMVYAKTLDCSNQSAAILLMS